MKFAPLQKFGGFIYFSAIAEAPRGDHDGASPDLCRAHKSGKAEFKYLNRWAVY
jgi:hypothetical protein